jgi:hypothetical protein
MGKKSEVVFPSGREHVPRENRDDIIAWVNAREVR